MVLGVSYLRVLAQRPRVAAQLVNLYNYVCVCVLYCGGHHDSDRMAVLVMVSQAEIIVL